MSSKPVYRHAPRYAGLAAALACIGLLLGGCAGLTGRDDATASQQDCQGLQLHHEWGRAQQACKMAIENARLDNVTGQPLAVLWHAYGKASGAVCDYGEAQRGLDEALKIDRATGSPAYRTLLEMARLNAAQGRYEEATAYFDAFWRDLPPDAPEKSDSAGLAEVLEDQAEAGRKSGKEDMAQEQRVQAVLLRAGSPRKTSSLERVPYGRHCGQAS